MNRLFLSSVLLAGCTATVTTAPPPNNPPPQRTVVVEQAPPPAAAPAPAPAPMPPSKHPAYIHALSDLRTARSFLSRPAGKMQVKWDENRAIREIDAAIHEIKEASIDDGKNIDDHPAVDAGMIWGDRLHKSLELVETARKDLNEEEDNGFARGLKARAIGHVDIAARDIKEGMEDAAHMPPPVVVAAPPPSKHPAYLHALTDLRTARSFLSRPTGKLAVKWDENRAIREIDAAIKEIKEASIDDGKNIEDHPPVDAAMVWGDRLHKSLELVETARKDLNEEEDNGFARGLKARAIGHVDLAARNIKEGVEDASHMPPPVAVAVVAGPGDHPAYLHALSDLRTARSLLEKPAHPDVKWDEQNAIREIDAAINEIKGAAIDDGKPMSDHPPIDAHLAHRDRLKQAQELLHKAAHDIDEREDNNFAKGLRARANGHINNAEHAVHEAAEDRKEDRRQGK